MSSIAIRTRDERAPGYAYVADSPLDFDSWLKLPGETDSELIRGVAEERMAASYPHEWIFAWLFQLLAVYVSHQKLGKVLGSRTAVKITLNDGRLPDILFVRTENDHIIEDDAIRSAPDAVIEIVSKNDSDRYVMQLETDYRTLGVGEIIFIDPARKRVKHIIRRDSDYEMEFLTAGPLEIEAVTGFCIEVEWLFADERPDPFTLLKQLIEPGRLG